MWRYWMKKIRAASALGSKTAVPNRRPRLGLAIIGVAERYRHRRILPVPKHPVSREPFRAMGGGA